MEYFTQDPPELKQSFRNKNPLDLYLRRVIPESEYDRARGKLVEMSELSTGVLWQLLRATEGEEPEFTDWDPWGNRVDRVEEDPLWKRARTVSLEFGLNSLPYETPYGPYSRVVQMALVYLFHPSSGFYTCPLAMTDGAARTLLDSENEKLIAEAIPHLTSSDQERFWLSGQWMTETAGGSDLKRSETEARSENGVWKLYGKKWFVSAVHSSMALALARPEDGDGELALFYVNIDRDRRPGENMTIDRLKDKLGTRRLPTGEVTLRGLPAEPVAGLSGGVKTIAPMLNRTRLWNSACAIGELRRALDLLKDYAQKRESFGGSLIEKPMFRCLLRELEAEVHGGLLLTLHVARIMGRVESGKPNENDVLLMRLLTPLAKISTARQSVRGMSEALEGFGGAGYIEDTGLPRMLRDAQVFPIWEGPTNVLVLEFLKTCMKRGGWEVLREDLQQRLARLRDSNYDELHGKMLNHVNRVTDLMKRYGEDRESLVEHGRTIVFSVTRAYHISLLAEQARWNNKSAIEGNARDDAVLISEGRSAFFP